MSEVFRKILSLPGIAKVFMIATLLSEIETKAKYHKPFKMLFSSGSYRLDRLDIGNHYHSLLSVRNVTPFNSHLRFFLKLIFNLTNSEPNTF